MPNRMYQLPYVKVYRTFGNEFEFRDENNPANRVHVPCGLYSADLLVQFINDVVEEAQAEVEGCFDDMSCLEDDIASLRNKLDKADRIIELLYNATNVTKADELWKEWRRIRDR